MNLVEYNEFSVLPIRFICISVHISTTLLGVQQQQQQQRQNRQFYQGHIEQTYGHNFVARLNPTVGGGRFTDERPHAMAQNRFVLFAQRKAERALLLHHNDFEFL